MLEAWAQAYVREDVADDEEAKIVDSIVANLQDGVPFVQLVSLLRLLQLRKARSRLNDLN